MLESNIKLVNDDINVLIKDAQALIKAAAALTGEKAEEMRGRAMRMLDIASTKTLEAQARAVVVGKEMASSTNDLVKRRPWQAVATAAGVGIVAGVLIGRK